MTEAAIDVKPTPATPAPVAPDKPAPAAEPAAKPAPAPAAEAKPAAPKADLLDVEDDEAPEAEAEGAEAADEGDTEAPDISAYQYEPPKGAELAPGAQERLDTLAAFSAQNDVSPEAFSGILQLYDGMVAEQKAKMAEADKVAAEAMQANLGETWGDQYDSNFAVARDGAKALPKSLRLALKTARTADGQLVSLLPEFAQLLHQLAGKPAIAGAKPFDAEATDARILEITRLRTKDFDEYIGGKYDVELAKLTERKAAHTPAARPVTLSADDKREAVIMKAMNANYRKYKSDGLDIELAAIRARRGAN